MHATVTRLAAAAAILLVRSAAYPEVTTCEQLASLALPNTTITLARVVPAGTFKPEKSFSEMPMNAASLYGRMPAFCRVAANVKPTADSDIRFEVWLPTDTWNGKFQAVGNGAWSGQIWYPFMAMALARGYATANTDTGHEGDAMDASFAVGHPEKVIDFGHRAVHEMTVQSKAIVAAFYGKAPRYAYWQGCSSGGKQGLKEAQRYPLDYDGIIAGAPANYWTHLAASGLWMAKATHDDSASFIPPAKFEVLHNAVVAACDATDGVKDGVLEDPRQCRFDPGVLACTGSDGPGCLTPPQVAAVRKIYDGPRNPRTGELVFPGLERGSEKDWVPIAALRQPLGVYESHYKYVVFADPQWNYRSLDFDRDVARADSLDRNTINATDPDLTTFVARGGKLLMYHGWSDMVIAPQNTVDYYERVRQQIGADQARGSVRLFMAPGMGHCFGGDGPFELDALTALERWVEQGSAPETMLASRSSAGRVVRTRPLCAYPRRATYVGSGSTDDAKNFVCKDP